MALFDKAFFSHMKASEKDFKTTYVAAVMAAAQTPARQAINSANRAWRDYQRAAEVVEFGKEDDSE